MVDAQADARTERCERMTRELAYQLLGLMDGLCETEQGRLAVAVLRYIATGEMKEPRGTERAFFRKACEMCDVQNKERDEREKESNEKESTKEKEIKERERVEREIPLTKPPVMSKILLPLFDVFWMEYPRKVDKKDAMKAWAKIKPSEFNDIMRGLYSWVRYWNSRGEDEFIPYPATWINKRRWESEPPKLKKNAALSYKQTPISETDFDSMTVDLTEV